MKRKKIAIFLIISLIEAAFFSFAKCEAPSRKMTLMIYMCGSNLESNGGAASEDLREMFASRAGNDEVTVLIMAGGSKEWFLGYNAEETTILKLRSGRGEKVWTGEKQNMGESSTLTGFLQYGKQNYPAEEYALILWDHGGGVLDGVCFDEQFSDDQLSYLELKKAIEDADLGKKLSWIGFDACLMGSLELASGLSSVAEYMIASQETEPPTGWNYSFLRDLITDSSPVETGKRIVDTYFGGQESGKDILTLACIDLRKAAEAAKEIGSFFSEVEKGISAETYPRFAFSRESARGFGTAARGIQEDKGYDLVDAEDLLRQVEGEPTEKEAALSALRDAILYQKSNVENACGLTLYHPWQNTDRYLQEWGKNYRALNLIDGYTKYVQSFGALLNKKELIRWGELYPQAGGRDENGNHLFSLQLTEKEAAHVASAQLMIVRPGILSSELDDSVTVVGVVKAEMTEGGILRASYDNKGIYAQTENGEISGKLGYTQTPDGKYDVILATYTPHEEMFYGNLGEHLEVLYYLNANDTSENPEVVHIRVWDDVTQSYTTRLSFDPSRYRYMHFWNDNRIYPDADDGVLPDFYEWDRSRIASTQSWSMPVDWHFVIRHEETKDTQLYAIFRITDVQQNTYCSMPVPLEMSDRTPVQFTPSEIDHQDYQIMMKGYTDRSAGQSMRLEITVANAGESKARCIIDNVILNQERELDLVQLGTSIEPGESRQYSYGCSLEELAVLENIETLTFQLIWETQEVQRHDQIVLHVDGINLDQVKPAVSLGQAESNGITVDLIDILQREDGAVSARALIQNNSHAGIEPRELIIDGVQLPADALLQSTNLAGVIEPGISKAVSFEWRNGLIISNDRLKWKELNYRYSNVVLIDQWLSQRGENKVDTFGVLLGIAGESGESVYLSGDLITPYAITKFDDPGSEQMFVANGYPKEAGEAQYLLPLIEDSRIKISLRNLVIGEKSVVLVMEAENRTREILRLTTDNYKLNGVLDPSGWGCEDIAPGCTKGIALEIRSDMAVQIGDKIQQLTFSFGLQGEFDRTVTLRLREPVSSGKDGQIIWASSAEVDVESVMTFSSMRKGENEGVDSFVTYLDKEAGISFDYSSAWNEGPYGSADLFLWMSDDNTRISYSSTYYYDYDYYTFCNYGGWTRELIAMILGKDHDEIAEKSFGTRNYYCFVEENDEPSGKNVCEMILGFENHYLLCFQLKAPDTVFEEYRKAYHAMIESIR